MDQFPKIPDLLSPKSPTIREVLQRRRRMSNYAGLERCFANLASPPSSSHILSASFSPTSLSEFLIICIVLSPRLSVLTVKLRLNYIKEMQRLWPLAPEAKLEPEVKKPQMFVSSDPERSSWTKSSPRPHL